MLKKKKKNHIAVTKNGNAAIASPTGFWICRKCHKSEHYAATWSVFLTQWRSNIIGLKKLHDMTSHHKDRPFSSFSRQLIGQT